MEKKQSSYFLFIYLGLKFPPSPNFFDGLDILLLSYFETSISNDQTLYQSFKLDFNFLKVTFVE